MPRLTAILLPRLGWVPRNWRPQNGPFPPCPQCGGRIMLEPQVLARPEHFCINCGWRPPARMKVVA